MQSGDSGARGTIHRKAHASLGWRLSRMCACACVQDRGRGSDAAPVITNALLWRPDKLGLVWSESRSRALLAAFVFWDGVGQQQVRRRRRRRGKWEALAGSIEISVWWGMLKASVPCLGLRQLAFCSNRGLWGCVGPA